jgi:hypothetical protein
LIFADLQNLSTQISISSSIRVPSEISNESGKYRLAGIVYYGEFHYICRVFDIDGTIWIHDGIWGSEACHKQGNIGDLNPKDLWNYRCGFSRKRAHAAIYSLTE